LIACMAPGAVKSSTANTASGRLGSWNNCCIHALPLSTLTLP
jgi:hypothetical protein